MAAGISCCADFPHDDASALTFITYIGLITAFISATRHHIKTILKSFNLLNNKPNGYDYGAWSQRIHLGFSIW
jgi:hypothetical protein